MVAHVSHTHNLQYIVFCFQFPCPDFRIINDDLGKGWLQKHTGGASSDTWSSGESIDISNLACADYDMWMVDEDNDACQIDEIFLCGDEGTMTLTDDFLLECQNNY